MVRDLLHPSPEEEQRTHKLKRLVQSPNSFFMDIKCPDSNMSHLMAWENINYLTKSDEIKFVLNSRKDYEWAKMLIHKYQLPDVATVLLGAVFGAISPRSVVQWILEDNLDVRFQLQLHKYIWEPQTRGV